MINRVYWFVINKTRKIISENYQKKKQTPIHYKRNTLFLSTTNKSDSLLLNY